MATQLSPRNFSQTEALTELVGFCEDSEFVSSEETQNIMSQPAKFIPPLILRLRRFEAGTFEQFMTLKKQEVKSGKFGFNLQEALRPVGTSKKLLTQLIDYYMSWCFPALTTEIQTLYDQRDYVSALKSAAEIVWPDYASVTGFTNKKLLKECLKIYCELLLMRAASIVVQKTFIDLLISVVESNLDTADSEQLPWEIYCYYVGVLQNNLAQQLREQPKNKEQIYKKILLVSQRAFETAEGAGFLALHSNSGTVLDPDKMHILLGLNHLLDVQLSTYDNLGDLYLQKNMSHTFIKEKILKPKETIRNLLKQCKVITSKKPASSPPPIVAEEIDSPETFSDFPKLVGAGAKEMHFFDPSKRTSYPPISSYPVSAVVKEEGKTREVKKPFLGVILQRSPPPKAVSQGIARKVAPDSKRPVDFGEKDSDLALPKELATALQKNRALKLQIFSSDKPLSTIHKKIAKESQGLKELEEEEIYRPAIAITK